MKFQYSPGLLGYGPTGSNGTDGFQGMSLYFTDYDTIFNKSTIETAIENNYTLWSNALPNTTLPADRVYITGDLFVNSRGIVYEIDASANTFSETDGQLSKSDYFTTNLIRTDDGVERWFNLADLNQVDGSIYTAIALTNVDLDTWTDNSPAPHYSAGATVANQYAESASILAQAGILEISCQFLKNFGNNVTIALYDNSDVLYQTLWTISASGTYTTSITIPIEINLKIKYTFNINTYYQIYRPTLISYGSSLIENYYLIDNTQLSSTFNYANISIYGINLNNFTRIECTDIIDGSFNAFTLYSTGENLDVDDHRALALVYENNLNVFKIGNIDTTNNVRNTSLTFDVSLLKHNRPFRFNKNTPSDSVLTNLEKNPVLLFDPNFNSAPISFQNYVASANDITINWKLSDFSNDTSVIGDLYFYKEPSLNKTYNLMDVSLGSTMIFHNVDASASVTISQLDKNQYYGYYMLLKNDGWERSSNKLTACADTNLYHMIVKDPVSQTLSADVSGWFSTSTYLYTMDVSTFVPTTWNASTNVDWIKFIPAIPTGGTGLYSFDVSLYKNTGATVRYGSVILKATSVPDRTVVVTQSAKTTTVTFDAAGNLSFSPALTDLTVSVGIKLYAWARANAGIYRSPYYTDTAVTSYKNGTAQSGIAVQAISDGSEVVIDTSSNHTINNINNTSTVYVYVRGDEYADGPDCTYLSTSNYEEGLGWAEIISITKTSGTGGVAIGANKYWYCKRVHTACALQKNYSSTEPLPPAVP